MLKHSVPGNWAMAASQLRSFGRGAQNRTGVRRSCEPASTSVMAGVWACRSCANEAAVKKIEPTKYVTLSAVAPTAFRYAGTDPNANNAEPMMKSQAIALLRSAGLTFMPFSSRNVVTPVGFICTGTEPQSHHPLGMSVPATGVQVGNPHRAMTP